MDVVIFKGDLNYSYDNNSTFIAFCIQDIVINAII